MSHFTARNNFGLIFARSFFLFDTLNLFKMKKTLIIALCCIVALMTACKKKPVDPTPDPEPVDYAANYVGNYIGEFTLTVLTMNNEEVNNWSFPVDSIHMDLAKGETFNSVTATVTVDNETRYTNGTASEEKADFETVHLIIDKPDQGYRFDLDLKMEGSKAENVLNITGSFTGTGTFEFNGQIFILDEVSGTVSGILTKQ